LFPPCGWPLSLWLATSGTGCPISLRTRPILTISSPFQICDVILTVEEQIIMDTTTRQLHNIYVKSQLLVSTGGCLQMRASVPFFHSKPSLTKILRSRGYRHTGMATGSATSRGIR
ncbi:hypothetical protein B0H11DRAFT_2129967, partial [Mycena galericulata]